MIPHPDSPIQAINCVIVTVSDTRTLATDSSGQAILNFLEGAGHQVADYVLVKDEPTQIQELLANLEHRQEVAVIILNGGTGIAPRDTTFDVVSQWLTKTLPGFGEIFRALSYQEIGSRAIASRATAGVRNHQLFFSLPGSSNAVKLAMSQLILPELNHLVRQLGS